MLKKVSKFQDHWYESAVLKQMITRYYRFMQLKTVYFPNILLIPTLDVEVVWQTHLLRPEIYRSDCLRLFHHIVDHSLLATEVQEFFKEQAFVETCQLYEERFGEQYCPLPKKKKRQRQPSCYSHYSFDLLDGSKYSYLYWDETLFQFSSYPPKNYENPFSFTETEIILDSCWLDSCKIFMHDAQDRVPIDFDYDRSRNSMDLDYGIIQRLKKLYERFLYMAAKYPLNDNSEFISPTYAIDIMWHAHMQEPLNYAADCLRLVGYVIPHAPWPTIDDKEMKKESSRADNIWRQEFQSEISTDHLYNTSEEI